MEINRDFNQKRFLEPKKLTYVPLEVINKDVNEPENKTMEENKILQQEEMFYTDLDKFRSEALKNTLVND